MIERPLMVHGATPSSMVEHSIVQEARHSSVIVSTHGATPSSMVEHSIVQVRHSSMVVCPLMVKRAKGSYMVEHQLTVQKMRLGSVVVCPLIVKS